MMRLLFCLLLTLGACTTSSSHRELRDGVPVQRAPVFVAPGYTPTGAGLPEYMPSGEATPRVPRGTDKRMLPETPASRREAGMWAGDETRASIEDLTPPKLLDVVLPSAPNATAEEQAMTRTCASQMDYALLRSGHEAVARNALLAPRQCIAALLYQYCAQRVVDNYTEKQSRGEMFDREFQRRALAMKHAADTFVGGACPEGVRKSINTAMMNETTETWEMVMKGPPNYDD